MSRLLLIILTGLLGGVVIHILVVLAFPAVGGRDLWEAAAAFGPEERFSIIPPPAPGDATIAFLDPNMAHAMCRFDLSSAPHRIVAALPGLWSVAIFNRRGQNLYSITGEQADIEFLDLLIAQPEQLTPLRRNPPPILEEALVIDLDVDRVIVVIRNFVADPTQWDQVAAQLAFANCGPELSLTADPTPAFRPGPVE